MAKTEKEKYDINHRWVDTAENIWTVSQSMKVSIEMADYGKTGDYTWNVNGDDVPCEFMELMLIPPKDSRFYKHLLEPDEALVARVWFEPSTAEPILCELVKEDPNMFHIETPYIRAEGFRKFECLNETVEFTEDEYNGIMDFARKTREFHTALGIKEYKGEEYINDFLYDHTLSSENSDDTKQFADWVNNEFDAYILSQKNAEKILEYYAEHEFDLLIGSDGKLYEYDPQEGFLDGFSEQSFENIIENTMGMIEQNGEIEHESDEMKAILKADLKAMEKIAEKMIDAKKRLKGKKKSETSSKNKDSNEAKIMKKHTKKSNGFEEWTEYDKQGNKIHGKTPTGFEWWNEYDKQGNRTHFKTSTGHEEWYEYDEHGNQTHYKNSDGFEVWSEYDEHGNQTYRKDDDGHEWWNEYDEHGKQTHFKNSDGFEWWYEYDEHGNQTYRKNSNGYEWRSEYDEHGKQIYAKNSDGQEEWYEYDKQGNRTHFKTSTGHEEWYEYDEHGNQTHYKNSDGIEEWYEYDKQGNQTYRKNSNGYEWRSEYDEHGNRTYYKNADGQEWRSEYDEQGNQTYYKDADGYQWWNEYDEHGNQIYAKNSDGQEEWTEYTYFEMEKSKAKDESMREKQENTFTINDTGHLERIKSVFGITLDMSSFAEYITRAEDEALEFYDDSTQKENGYSFKDYAGGQMALGFLSDMYPEFSQMEDYLPDLGWNLDEICTKVASGELKNFNALQDSLADTVEELKKDADEEYLVEIDACLEDIKADSPVISSSLEKMRGFLGKDVMAFDILDHIGNVGDWGEDEGIKYKTISFLADRLQTSVATKEELENDTNCKLQNAAFDMAARILSGDEKISKDAALDYLKQYGIKVGVIEEKHEPALENENSKEHDRAMRNLRTALGGIKNGYSDSLDDYIESMYTRKGMWSVYQKTEKEATATEIRYSDITVFEISGGEMRIPAGAKTTLAELEKKGILAEDVRKEVAKMYPGFWLSLTKKEFAMLEKVVANNVSIDAENKCAFRASDGAYLSARKILEYTAPEKQSQMEREKLSDSDKKVLGNIQRKLSEISAEKTPDEALSPALKDLHAALDGIVNRRNNNLDVYIEDRKTEKGSWSITRSSDNLNGQISIDYNGKPFAIIEKDTVALLATKDKIEKMGINIEDVMSEIGAFDERFNVSLTKEEASFIDEISQTLREHDSVIVGEKEHPYDMDRKCYIGRQSLLEYIDTELDEINPEQKKEWLASLTEEKRSLYESLKEKLSEDGISENVKDMNTEMKKSGDLSDHMMDGLSDVIQGYIIGNTSDLDEYDPGHGARKEMWSIREKAADEDTGDMSEFDVVYQDEYIVATVKDGKITDRLDEVQFLKDELSFHRIADAVKLAYPKIKEKESPSDKMSWKPVSDMTRWNGKTAEERFKMLERGADAMSAMDFGEAEDIVEKAFKDISNDDLLSLMEMRTDDNRTLWELWEDEFSYLQSTNEEEGIENDGSVPSSLMVVRTMRERAATISKDEFFLAPSLNDRFKWLSEGADAMSAEKFGTAENFVEKAFMGLSDTELVSLMEMKDEDGNTAIEIWENEYSYLQNVNEIEDFEDRDVVPSSFAEVKNAQDKAHGIKFMREKDGQLRLRHGKYRAAETLMNFVNEKFSSEILDMPDADRILYEYWETSSDIIIDEKNGSLFWQREKEEMENVDVFDMLNDIEIWNNGLVEEGRANDPIMNERYEQTNEMLSRVKENIKKARGEKTVSVSEKPISEYTTQELWNEINHRDDFLGGKIWVKDDIELYFVDHSDEFEELGYENIKVDEKLVDRVADNIHPDWLSDCTDAEWSVFDTAWRDTLKDMQKKKAEKIKNQAVSATHGIDVNSVLKEAKEKKRKNKEVGQPAQKKNSGIER